MRWVTREFAATGSDFILSPEQWISLETAAQLPGGVPFDQVVSLVSRQTTPPTGARYVLDTGNARDGVLDLPILGDPTSERTSSKKTVREGDVIVSRLRPYLRQVALIPPGISELLGQQEFYCSTEFLVFRRRDGRDAGGIVAWLLSGPIQKMMSEAATGGHHPRIGPEMLLSACIPEQFLDQDFSLSISRVLSRHVQSLRELAVLLRH